MFSLLVSLALAQTSPNVSPDAGGGRGAAVLVSRQSGVTPSRAADVANRVYAELLATGVPVVGHPSATRAALADAGAAEPTSCGSELGCLASLGRAVGVQAVIAVEVAAVLEDLAIRLVEVDSVSARSRAEHTFVASAAGSPAELALQIEPFAKQVAALGLKPREVDVPRAAALVPVERVEAEPHPAVVAGSSRTGAYVATGGAAALGISAIALGLMGMQSKRSFESERIEGSSPPTYRLTRTEMQSLADQTNLRFGLAAGAAVTSVGVGALATWLWTRD